MLMRLLRPGVVLLAAVLAGCSSGSLLSDVSRALYQQQFGALNDPTQSAPLNPAYRYLRAQMVGYPAALLVLGYVDPHPGGDVEVWYGADKEVIKIQRGRIVGTAGLPVDWRNVRFDSPLPSWSQVDTTPQTVLRVRDQMPGYRYSLQSRLTLQALAEVPAIELPSTLPRSVAQRYRWYRESSADGAADNLPASWFAVDLKPGVETLMFSVQCLAPDLCLRLQRWPAQKAPT